MRRQRAHAAEQVFLGQHVQHRQAGGAGQRVAAAGVAVHQLGQVRRAVHQRVVDLAAHDDAAQRRGTVAHGLGEQDHVGHHAQRLGTEHGAQAAEAGDDLVEDEQDAVPRAQLAQSLQVAQRRHQHAGGAGHRLDEHRGNVGSVVQRHQAFQLVGHVGTGGGLATHEGLRGRVPGAAQVVGAQHRGAEGAPVGRHAADADAAEAHAVEAALAADEQRALALALRAPEGQRDLHRGVAGLGAAVHQEHAVQARRRHGRDALGQFEGAGVADLEVRRIVQRVELALHGSHDARVAVAGTDAPQAGNAVQHLAALGRPAAHAFGTGEQARCGLERPVGRVGHPEGLVPHRAV